MSRKVHAREFRFGPVSWLFLILLDRLTLLISLGPSSLLFFLVYSAEGLSVHGDDVGGEGLAEAEWAQKYGSCAKGVGTWY